MHIIPVGAGLSGRRIAAMATCQLTNLLRMHIIPCGSEPAREAVDLAVAFDLDLSPLSQRPNAGIA
jgi:hypothetical protein